MYIVNKIFFRIIIHLLYGVGCVVFSTLVPEVFSSLGATKLSGKAAMASREAPRKKPLVPTDNNLTSMPTPISFD